MFPLQLKIAALVAVFVAIAVVGGDWLVQSSVDRNLESALSAQLELFARHVAGQVDRDLLSLRQELAEAGNVMEEALLAPEPVATTAEGGAAADGSPTFSSILRRSSPRFWRNHSELRMFDYGLLLLGPNGQRWDDSLKRPELEGADFSKTDYFKAAKVDTSGEGVVSSPYISYIASQPDFPAVVMFAVALRAPADGAAEAGRLLGVLCGGIDLSKNPLLARYTDIPFGDGGVIALVTPSGRVVAHTDRERVLATISMKYEELQGKAHWRTFDEQRAGLTVTIPLQSVDWRLAVWQPTESLQAAFLAGWREARTRFWLGGVVAVAVAWGLGWWLSRDLSRLARQVGQLGRIPGEAGLVRVGPEGGNEAGQLAKAINLMLADIERSRGEVRQLATDLARAEERERRSIAVDLHDSVCQTLAVANLELGRLRQRLAGLPAPGTAPDGDGAGAVVDEVMALAGQARARVGEGVKELRTLIFDLSPPILYELGLPAALGWLAEGFQGRFGVPLRVRDRDDNPAGTASATSEQAIFLYRAAREAAVNAAKHAHASEIVIDIEWLASEDGAGGDGRAETPQGRWAVTVSDDGVGFDPERMWKQERLGGGFGLRTVRERLTSLGGKLRVESSPGRGTRVYMEVAG